jgi:hypothetical protein
MYSLIIVDSAARPLERYSIKGGLPAMHERVRFDTARAGVVVSVVRHVDLAESAEVDVTVTVMLDAAPPRAKEPTPSLREGGDVE